MHYRLKISVEKITLRQWVEILETLRKYDDFGYKILENDEEPLEYWYGTSMLHFAHLISTSKNYNLSDEYVLEDAHDEKTILKALSPRFKEALALYRNHLENSDFGLPNMLEIVFEIDERDY